jgi:hypothetical protein
LTRKAARSSSSWRPAKVGDTAGRSRPAGRRARADPRIRSEDQARHAGRGHNHLGGVKRPAFEDGQVNARDRDASFTVKGQETFFGYGGDEESVLRQAEMTSADLHDSQRGEAVFQDEADKAYDGRAVRDRLAELVIEDKIAYKAQA